MARYEESCQAHLMANPEFDNGGAGRGSQPKASGYAENYITEALAMALRNPSPQVSFTLAEEAEAMGLYRQASTAYQAAIDRSNEVRADWYYRLGKSLTLAEDFKAAAASFRMSRVFDYAHGVDTTDYRKDRGLLNVMYYTSWRESVPLREDVILYESFHGDSISCNPLAIFEELSRREEFDDYLHVWVANDNALYSERRQETHEMSQSSDAIVQATDDTSLPQNTSLTTSPSLNTFLPGLDSNT